MSKASDGVGPGPTGLVSPQEIMDKTFAITKFREGYDQDEVDDYLDKVRETIVALQGSVTELEGKVRAGGAGGPNPAAVRKLESDLVAARQSADAFEARMNEAEARAQHAEAQVASRPAETPDPERAGGMLFLAQKLADQHVEDAKAEAEKIKKEADQFASQVVGEAEVKAERRTAEAEDAYRRRVAEGERRASDLNDTVRSLETRKQDLIDTIRGTAAAAVAAVNDEENEEKTPRPGPSRSGARAASATTR